MNRKERVEFLMLMKLNNYTMLDLADYLRCGKSWISQCLSLKPDAKVNFSHVQMKFINELIVELKQGVKLEDLG